MEIGNACDRCTYTLIFLSGAHPALAPVACTPGRSPAAFIAHYLTVSTMLHVGRSQAGRALPGVRKPASSVRGTCIVVPQAALLAVPDAPPRFFAHRARSAPVPLAARACSPGQVQCCTLADHGPGAQNPVWFQKEEPPHVWGFFLLESGSVLLSRAVTSQVPSALKGLTSVFGMGTGGSLSP